MQNVRIGHEITYDEVSQGALSPTLNTGRLRFHHTSIFVFLYLNYLYLWVASYFLLTLTFSESKPLLSVPK